MRYISFTGILTPSSGWLRLREIEMKKETASEKVSVNSDMVSRLTLTIVFLTQDREDKRAGHELR